MSAAIISTIATTNSIIAMQQAQEASIAACHALMPVFQGSAATVESAQAYAQCVRLINPSDMTSSDVVFIKILIILALAGMVIGLFIGYKSPWDRLTSMASLSLIWAIFLPSASVLLFAIYAGVRFLFT